MKDMLDAAALAVFQEGYTDGYVSGGDHIKEESDIKKALSLGISMLTLDCSDQIPKGIDRKTAEEIETDYNQLPEAERKRYEESYLNKSFEVKGLPIDLDKLTLMTNVLQYHEAIQYMVHVYKTYMVTSGRDINYKISVDETETITSPLAHFFVANELQSDDVKVISLSL